MKQMMIFAAGRGRRLEPLTATMPKPLVRLAGKPLIVYHLEVAQRLGITNVVINVSYLGQMIIEFLGDGRRWGLNIQYSVESEPLETAGGLVHARHLLDEGEFLLCNADIYHEMHLESLLCQADQQNCIRLVMVPNPSEQPDGNFWLSEQGFLSAKALEGGRALTYSGIGVYTTAFIESIDGLASADPESRRTPFYLQRWMRDGRVRGVEYPGRWCDVGTPQRLEALEAELVKQQTA